MAGTIPTTTETRPFVIAQAVRELFQGRSLAEGTVTLEANETTTVVPAPNCGEGSRIFLSPQTANAADALATTYIAPANIGRGTFTITHANTADTDKTFSYAIRG